MSEESMLTEQEEEYFADGFFRGSPIGHTYESEGEDAPHWYAPWEWTSRDMFWCSGELSLQKNGELFALDYFVDLFGYVIEEKERQRDEELDNDLLFENERDYSTYYLFDWRKDKTRGVAFLTAVENGDVEVVKSSLDSDAVDTLDKKDVFIALMLSAYHGHAEVVNLLLETGIDVDVKDSEENTALVWASRAGHTEVVKLLLKAGADINSNDGLALHEAIRNGHAEVVNILVKSGGYIDPEEDGDLITAIESSRPELAKLLLEADVVDANDENSKGESALALAAQAGYAEVVKALLEAGADVNKYRRNSPLKEAVYGCCAGAVKLLLEAGAKIDSSFFGDVVCLLHKEDGSIEGAKTLLKSRPADDTKRMEWDYNALKWTIVLHYFEMTKVLIEAEVDVNAKNNEGMTALMWASLKESNLGFVKFLLDAGADIDAKDNDYGRNALMWAVSAGNAGTISLLLKEGVDVNAKSKKGWTPLMMASEKRGENVKLLLESGADVNAKNEDGETALMVASSWGYPSVMKHLLEAGADINVKSKRGWPALIFAAQKNQYTAADLLLKAGVGINDKDECGKTALMWAAQKGFYSTVKFLIEAGADISVKADDGGAALDFAEEREYPDNPSRKTLEEFDKTIELLKAAQKS